MSRKILFFPVIDNGMGLSSTLWSMSFAEACLGPLREYDVILRHLSYPYCSGALNIATNEFLLTGAEEMVTIDTDIVYPPQHLKWLLEHEEPIVFGLYPQKVPGLVFPLELLDTTKDPFAKDVHTLDVTPLVEVKRIARGFSRIHRSVFEKLAPMVPEYRCEQTGRMHKEFWKYLPGGHSEDFAFCDQWRAAGGKILLDQRISTQHDGRALYPIPGTY